MKNRVQVFVDGAYSSKTKQGGWAAIVCSQMGIKILSGSCENTTNNRMELLAVVNSLTYLTEQNIISATIISDSAYVVNTINLGWMTKWRLNYWRKSNGDSVKNSDLWQTLYNVLAWFKAIKFVKIKGHSGERMNELADKYAKQMSREKII